MTQSTIVQIAEELICYVECLATSLYSDRSTHDISQAYGVPAHVERTWETDAPRHFGLEVAS